jgi:hypothetical protein
VELRGHNVGTPLEVVAVMMYKVVGLCFLREQADYQQHHAVTLEITVGVVD